MLNHFFLKTAHLLLTGRIINQIEVFTGVRSFVQKFPEVLIAFLHMHVFIAAVGTGDETLPFCKSKITIYFPS